jgi:hypothetical protein
MKSVPLVLALAAQLALATFTNAQAKSDEQAIRKLIADFAEAINRGDAKAFATFFTKDADFVVITGKYLKGRNEIVTYHHVAKRISWYRDDAGELRTASRSDDRGQLHRPATIR